jgi:hypothetical protein
VASALPAHAEPRALESLHDARPWNQGRLHTARLRTFCFEVGLNFLALSSR